VFQERISLIWQRTNRSSDFKNSTRSHYRFPGADQLTEHVAKEKGGNGKREHTDGRERSSASLRACSLLAVLLTVASDEALKLPLDDSLPLSSSSPPCSSSMSMAAWLPSGAPPPLSPPFWVSSPFLVECWHQGFSFYISSYLPRPPTGRRPLFYAPVNEIRCRMSRKKVNSSNHIYFDDGFPLQRPIIQSGRLYHDHSLSLGE
jgi:hypothetical protein